MNVMNASDVTDGHGDVTIHGAVPIVCGCVLLVVWTASICLCSVVLAALWRTRQLATPVNRLLAFLLIDELLVRCVYKISE